MKSIFFLGLGCNFFTLTGVAIGMVVLGKTGWVVGIFEQLWVSCCLAPTFMGDAVNSYVLSRIRLDGLKGWDDVQITPEGRAALGRLHRFWRTLSFLPALMLGLILLTSLAPDPMIGRPFFPLFLALFVAHSAHCLFTVRMYFAPRVPSFGGSWVIRRAVVTGAIFGTWLLWLWTRASQPFSSFGFLANGTFYFLICAVLQPLPSKFMLLRASQAKGHDLSVTQLPQGIENPAEKIAVDQASAWWKGEVGDCPHGPSGNAPGALTTASCAIGSPDGGAFTSLGSLRMPLIELPLFGATGDALRSPDGKIIVLILISEVKPCIHRSLISHFGDQAIITTDFGAPDARFPEGFQYETRPAGEADHDLLARHLARLPANIEPVEDPPWDFLAALSIMMLQFLARKKPRNTATDDPPAASAKPRETIGNLPNSHGG